MAVPSGKFWIPIPIDKIRAGTRLVLTLAMAIPTAKPSGILCKVIASNKSLFLGFLFAQLFSSILPFALSFAAGAMMFVCIEELIPEANALKEVDVGTMSFMVGFMIMMMLDVMFG